MAVAIDHQQLAHEVADANALADIDAVRTALLRAVSHDLRTPLASIKAMVTGLLDRSVDWTDDQIAEALAAVDEETDRLNRLVGMAPFQRLGDTQTDGVGLGMSIAQGFVVASGGSLTLDDTPGGGLTVTMALSTGSPAQSSQQQVAT